MSTLNKQELQVIQAFSAVDLPERIFRESNIKELIAGMTAEQETVQASAKKLDRLRQEQKEGNVVSNWWKDRDDLLQDAQIDLNKSIGRLTQKSSQLLIVNSAISKLLNQQQQILLKQQTILEEQTRSLAGQNQQILEQQTLLEQQQLAINEANQGLMEAKGITQQQAKQLVGCVKRVTEAEKTIGDANDQLLATIEQRLSGCISDAAAQLQNGLAEQEGRQEAFQQQVSRLVAENRTAQQNEMRQLQETLTQSQQQHYQQLLTELELKSAMHTEAVAAVASSCHAQQQELRLTQDTQHQRMESAIDALQTQYLKSRRRHRLALTALSVLSVLSVGWQLAVHFY